MELASCKHNKLLGLVSWEWRPKYPWATTGDACAAAMALFASLHRVVQICECEEILLAPSAHRGL